jgi:hypothetical protein
MEKVKWSEYFLKVLYVFMAMAQVKYYSIVAMTVL